MTRRTDAASRQPGVQSASPRPPAGSGAPQKPRKYRNTPTTVNGLVFDSKREAERYGELVVAERAGEIKNLEVHPRFPLVIHEQDCGAYVADFSYVTRDGLPVIEDVKSPATRKLPTYRLKARMVWALYGLKVREVMP